MKPAAFDHVAPTSIEEALAALSTAPDDARVLAGGQSLVALMNLRLASPALVVDINRIADLASVHERDNGIAIGAIARQRDVERSALVAARCPILIDALRWVAHPQLRNRGTVVGSLVHHDPAAELPTVAVTLDARLTLRSATATRIVDARDFFLGHYASDVRPDELVTEVWFPTLPAGTGTAFEEIARRQGDFALVGVAVVLTETDGQITSARVGLCAMGDRPIRAAAVEAALEGRPFSDDAVALAVAALSDEEMHPLDDIHATAHYRRRVAPVVLARALRAAASRIGQRP